MKKLIIDNYDSFTYNLYHLAGGADIIRNDELTLNEIKNRNYSHIFISPGPGSPDKKEYFGICPEVITDIGMNTPILGVCLGLQGIWHCFGGSVVSANQKKHGKTSIIQHSRKTIFQGVPQNIKVMRYHSLIADPETKPNNIKIIATTFDNKEIMAIQHTLYPIFGVQFHPESFATEYGKLLVQNFLKL